MKDQPVTSGRATVAYLRTGTTGDEAQTAASLRRQLRACHARARRTGATISATYTDAGKSGLSRRRPGLNQLLRDVEAGRIATVITSDPTRLARSRTLESELEQQTRFHGTRLAHDCRPTGNASAKGDQHATH